VALVVCRDLQRFFDGGRNFLEAMKWLAFVAVAAIAIAQEQPSVILISIDTLRADHLSTYGYRKIRTPHIDSFAEQGTVFTDASSQIPLTLPSHTSLFTSTYPFENGLEENAEMVPKDAVTLASVLRSHGYKTAAFAGSNMLDRRFGLDLGFDDYDSPFDGANSARVRRDGALVVRAASAWLSAHRGQPVFLFIHLFDLHTPYRLTVSRGSSEPETTGYDAELEYIEGVLGRFRQSLIEKGWWKKSLVVLFGDHGESLGDHGELSHGYFIYQSTVHVPLMFHWPDGTPQHPARITQAAALIDVAPTILMTLGIAVPKSFDGVNLMGENTGHAIYSESVYARDSFHWAALRGLRLGSWKYIDAPHPELFDLEKDPAELANLARTNPAQVASMRIALSRLMAQHAHKGAAPARDTSAATKTALGSLGYLAGGSSKNLRDGPDPKDRLTEYQMFDRALDAMYSQRLDVAIRGFQHVLAVDRENLPARGNLGDAYLRSGKTEDAIREWTTALTSHPDYFPAAQALGEFYTARKDWPKALRYLQQALKAAPSDTTIRFELGIAEKNLGVTCQQTPSTAACREILK
jgi:arylsulfatase A-like enzyme